MVTLGQVGLELARYQRPCPRIGSLKDDDGKYFIKIDKTKLEKWPSGLCFVCKPQVAEPPFVDGHLYGGGDKAGVIWASSNAYGKVIYTGKFEEEPREWGVLYVVED